MIVRDKKVEQRQLRSRNSFEVYARQLKEQDPKGYVQAMEFVFFAVHGRLPTKKELRKEIKKDGL
jgi:hypothetical protein